MEPTNADSNTEPQSQPPKRSSAEVSLHINATEITDSRPLLPAARGAFLNAPAWQQPKALLPTKIFPGSQNLSFGNTSMPVCGPRRSPQSASPAPAESSLPEKDLSLLHAIHRGRSSCRRHHRQIGISIDGTPHSSFTRATPRPRLVPPKATHSPGQPSSASALRCFTTPLSIPSSTATASPRTSPRALAHGLTIHRSSVSSL
ncbi:hypothetical protein E4U19_005159 [Claviceps sp. Clav32 group G5]|nr:hypothetical protein E4U19_005159 [Claviceps sp. Clav32 group G5]